MRILVVDTYYPEFLRRLYADRPELADASYSEQLEVLAAQCFGISDAYSHHLRELGHDAADVVVNCVPLQARWAAERGLRVARPLGALARREGVAARALRLGLMHCVAHTQIERFDPDVVYVQDVRFFEPAEIRRLRSQGRLVVCQIATLPPSTRRVAPFNMVLSSLPNLVDRFRAGGADARYFRIGFYSKVLDRLRDQGVDANPASPRSYDVSFVGGLDRGIHRSGTEFLEDVCGRLNVDVWGYGAESLESGSPILRRYHGEAWGMDMYRVLAQSRIVINRHIPKVAANFANNMRLYEATGVGAVLATEQAANLPELFEPGREVVAFGDADQLVAEVERLLSDEPARLAVARAGQQRTLRDHTYAQRIGELADMLAGRLQR